jgi:sugar lactone lactonase YvrE
MPTSGRYTDTTPARTAEGWSLRRVTPPSRLAGANGIRTGADNRIYVAQVAGSAVSVVDPDTGDASVLSAMGEGIVGPDDLAFDSSGNLYCTEITEGRVVERAPNGSVRVIHGDMPVANPITVYQDRIIAGELRMDGRIIELDRDGGNHRVIFDKCPMVNAFDVGPDGKLYFPAQGANEIWRIDLDGGEPEVVAKNLGVPDSVKFHPDGYIVSTQVYSGQVLKIDPRTGAQEVLANIGAGLDNVTFVGKRIFVSHITGSIHELLGGGQVKAVIEQGYQWPLGLGVWPDGTLLVGDGGFAHLLTPGSPSQVIGNYFVPNYPGWVRDVAPVGEDEWVVTTADGVVARWRPKAQESEVLSSGHDGPFGVAVGRDGAIAFSVIGTGAVRAIEGGQERELASGLDRPQGVAIDPSGTVYVAESGKGRVVKLVGGRSETVVDDLGEPQGLAIAQGKLYVLDVGARELIECDLEGRDRRVLASDLPVGSPSGTVVQLGGVPNFCGPMTTFSGVAVGGNGTIYLSGSAEGSVLALVSTQ